MSMEKTEYKNGEVSPLQKLYNYYSSPISLDKDERKSGLYAWAFFLGLVAAYDAYAIKTKKVETPKKEEYIPSDEVISLFIQKNEIGKREFNELKKFSKVELYTELKKLETAIKVY